MEVQQFYYDNKIVKKFLYATMFWGIVGMSVGLLLAFMFMFPNLTDGISWLSFGRLRPLHTNAVIFAFVGNAIFAGVYYSTQRLLKARMFSDFLSQFLGMAIDHRRRCDYLALGVYHLKGICRIGMANRYCHCLGLGRFWREPYRNDDQTPPTSFIRCYMVLCSDIRYRRRITYL